MMSRDVFVFFLLLDCMLAGSWTPKLQKQSMVQTWSIQTHEYKTLCVAIAAAASARAIDGCARQLHPVRC